MILEDGPTPALIPRPKLRTSRGFRIGTISRSIGLIAIILVFAVPILWMILTSLKSTNAISTETIPLSWRSFIPAQPTMENFLHIFGVGGFATNLWNSAVIAILQVVGSVILASVAGYAFGRLRFPGRNKLFLFCLMCAFIPIEAILLPEYRLIVSFGLTNTYLGVFLPFLCSPFAIFLMRQAFMELPGEMFEAAKIDGVGHLGSFLRIAVPNVRPALVTAVLVQFIWAWNAYVWPLLVLQDKTMQTAQVALASYASVPNHPMTGEMFAASTAVTIPLVVLAVFLQRYYVRGLVMSGGK